MPLFIKHVGFDTRAPGIKKPSSGRVPLEIIFFFSKRVSKFLSCCLPAFGHSLPCLMDFDASFNVEETKMPFTQALLFYGLKASIFVGTGSDQHSEMPKSNFQDRTEHPTFDHVR